MSSLKRFQSRCSLQFWTPRQQKFQKIVLQACKTMKRQFFQVRISFNKMSPWTLRMQFLPISDCDEEDFKRFFIKLFKLTRALQFPQPCRILQQIFESFLSSMKLFMKNNFSKTFFSTKSSYGLVSSSFHNPAEKFQKIRKIATQIWKIQKWDFFSRKKLFLKKFLWICKSSSDKSARNILNKRRENFLVNFRKVMKKTKTFQNKGSPKCSYWHGVNSLGNLAKKISTEGQKLFSHCPKWRKTRSFFHQIIAKVP